MYLSISYRYFLLIKIIDLNILIYEIDIPITLIYTSATYFTLKNYYFRYTITFVLLFYKKYFISQIIIYCPKDNFSCKINIKTIILRAEVVEQGRTFALHKLT